MVWVRFAALPQRLWLTWCSSAHSPEFQDLPEPAVPARELGNPLRMGIEWFAADW